MEADIPLLRDFANSLQPADLAKIRLGDDLLGGMKECEDPHRFINAWTNPTAGFGRDLLSGVDGCRTVALNAATQIATADKTSGDIMAEQIGKLSGAPHADTSALSTLPHTRPDGANQPVEPPEQPEPDAGWQPVPGFDANHVPPGIGQGR